MLKLGSDNFEELKQFSVCIEEKLFKMDAHRDRALTYKTEEVQLTAVDEVYVEQDKTGHVIKQLCRVRVFFLSFLTGNVIDAVIHHVLFFKKASLQISPLKVCLKLNSG